MCKKAQSLTEYAILIGIVTAALIAMQIYIKRGIQGRIKDLADQLSERHYEPLTTDAEYNVTQTGTRVSKYEDGVFRNYYDGTNGSVPESIVRKGYEITYPDEYPEIK